MFLPASGTEMLRKLERNLNHDLCARKVNEPEVGVRSSRRERLPFTSSSSWASARAMSRLMQSRCQMALAADPGFPLRKAFPGGKVQVHGEVTFPDSLFFYLFSSR